MNIGIKKIRDKVILFGRFNDDQPFFIQLKKPLPTIEGEASKSMLFCFLLYSTFSKLMMNFW